MADEMSNRIVNDDDIVILAQIIHDENPSLSFDDCYDKARTEIMEGKS